uniref:Retrotransposon protein, putative, Ty1-copia subclass n=1 Tax=Tanacetum cinerariifolium TaxID=118510 RepID=A0A6L2JLW6_TANCI|nr:retrotransposon protein, putative, Ty1-copia subclass [Tanacetum cinerariifolium]
MVRLMMNLTTLPLSFWDYDLECATRTINMVPPKKVDKTPYELWYRKVPNLSYLKVWGCEALVERDTPNKLQQKSVKCIFVGYPKETMGYYFYFPPENKIIVARVDYKETFSPVADIRAIRILIAIAALYDYEIWQMDVKTSFLNGYLDEDIYMVQPKEVEYIAASEAAMEAVWIKKFISRLGIVPTINEPIKMLCDNLAALFIANESRVQRDAKHYHRRYHYIRECIVLGEINILKVHTDNNLADSFTKALPKGKLTQHARSIGLHLASSFM